MISQDRMEAALNYLAQTDHDYAKLKTRVEECEILVDRVKARCFVSADGSVADRTAKSRIADDTVNAETTYIEARLEYETLKALRDRAEILIGVWRSVEASRRVTT